MILSFRGKWLISLLMLLLVSVGVQAQDISVEGTPVTSKNASDVLGDGKVSFEPTTNTLTLNGAVITLSESTPYAVSSGIKDLKIKLIGENVINATSSPVFDCEPDAEEGDITFVTETGPSGAVYGSLQINGIYQYDNLTERYHIKNTWLEGDEDGWHKKEMGNGASEEKYVKLFYAVHYDLWVSGTRLSTENRSSIAEGVSFDGDQTLTLNNANITVNGNNAIESGLANLTVYLVGESIITCQGNDDAAFKGTVDGAKVYFDTNASATGSLQVQVNENMFSNITAEYAEPLILENEGWTYTIAEKGLGLSVAGVEVKKSNAGNVLGDGKVSYNDETNTLMLNNATINGGIRCGIDGTLTVQLVGENVIDGGYVNADNNGEMAFVGELETTKLVITTDAENPGQLLIKNTYVNQYDIAKYYSDNMHPSLKNGLYESYGSGNKHLIAVGTSAVTPAEGLYWTDQQYSLSDGAQLSVSNSQGNTIEVSVEDGVFALTEKGKYNLSVWKTIRVDETDFNVYGAGGRYFVHEKPGFSVEAGTYDEAQHVKLTNLPSTLPTGETAYPQVWYYLGNQENDSVRITSADQEISVTASTKVCVYFIDEDSGKVFKSATVEAEYTIRQTPAYHFSTSSTGTSYINNGSTVSNLEYGGEDNVLPWLINVPEGMTITYSSEDVNVATVDEEGHITLTGAGYVWISASNAATDVYAAHEERIRLEIRPSEPTISLEHGIYYTGTEVTLTPTVPNGTMYYSWGENGEKIKYETGDVITLPKGDVTLCAYTRCGTEEEYKESYSNNRVEYFVYDQPTFTLANGTYNGAQEVKIENLPTDDADVYYYFYDETLQEEDANMVKYEANTTIPVTETSILKALIARVDSGKQIKTQPVEAQYVIRQDAGLSYGDTEVVEYIIGGENNPALPVLENPNELTVTYNSEDEDVATVNATTGEVTIVGMGETTITATSEQTDELLAGEASYILRVNKDLNHSSIQVTLSELTYNGQAQTPTVTVKDGDVTLTLDEHYSIVAPEVGNTNAIAATAENAPVITLISETAAEVNYYVGSREIKFGIAPKQLEEDMVELSATTLPYSGENQKPTVTVADGELMTTNDYTITNEGGVEIGEYTVKVVAKNNYTGTVEKNFEIVTRTLEIGKDVNFATGQTWASYYTTTEDLVLPENLMAYIVTAVSDEAVTVKAINYVPKNVPVLIENNSTATTDNTSAEGNLLQGTASATNVSDIADNAYVLYNNGFTRATSGSIPAHRAYLVLAEPAGARLAIFDEETTGMEAVSRDKVATYENIYDLQGRKISNGQWSMVNGQLKKGLYIMNGKKIVVK